MRPNVGHLLDSGAIIKVISISITVIYEVHHAAE